MVCPRIFFVETPPMSTLDLANETQLFSALIFSSEEVTSSVPENTSSVLDIDAAGGNDDGEHGPV